MHLSTDQQEFSRHIVVALDLSDQSHKCLQWTAFELARPGDLVHIVHVARCLSPQTTIQHASGATTLAAVLRALIRSASLRSSCLSISHTERRTEHPVAIAALLVQAYPGSSYTVPDPNPIDEKAYAHDVRELINSKWVPFVFYLLQALCCTPCRLADCCSAADRLQARVPYVV